MSEQEQVISITHEELFEHQEKLKKYIDRAEKMKRLIQHPDFKELFEEFYMKEEAARYVHLLGEDSFNMRGKEIKDAHREEIQEALIGIARFRQFISTVSKLGERASNELEASYNYEFEDTKVQ